MSTLINRLVLVFFILFVFWYCLNGCGIIEFVGKTLALIELFP